MGWSGGSRLMSELITSAKKHVPDAGQREAFYRDAIRMFQNEDCDTLDECEGEDPAYDSAMKRKRKS